MYVVIGEGVQGTVSICQHAVSIEKLKKLLVRAKFDLAFIDFDNLEKLDWGRGVFYRNSESKHVTIFKLSTRNVFMDIYRDEFFNEEDVSVDDRHEVFSGIMLGSSDFEAEEINSVLANYNVTHIQAVDITEPYDAFCARLDNLKDMSSEYHERGEQRI